LCDVGRVAVKDCFKLLSFFTFIFVFAVLLQFNDCINYESQYAKGINFNSGLNIYGTVVFSDRDCL